MSHCHQVRFVIHLGKLSQQLVSTQNDFTGQLHEFVEQINFYPNGLILIS